MILSKNSQIFSANSQFVIVEIDILFFVKEYQANRKVLKCPDPWCGIMIGSTDPTTQTTGANAAAQIVNKCVRNCGISQNIYELQKKFCMYNIINCSEKDETQNEEISPVICTLLQLLSHLTMLLGDIGTSEVRVPSLWKKIKGIFLLLSKITKMKEGPLCRALHDWFCELPQWFNKVYINELDKVDSQSIEKFERDIEKNYSQFFNKAKKSSSMQKIFTSTTG
ncbi:hypothetical protein RFI_31613 [Reticulomyxa filosa]|uniref:Uncharacterized protein n=1 Tax=Reticulomyxa filosa TaxID=46433 RepID=X6LXB8_RETFI|nr:hypothetical protein RFI_31613 [Reticulomyxa filosa]|eukprot:ETO05782.1 hypothetical protein RFI_31613 [Reticulomyxa filosa]